MVIFDSKICLFRLSTSAPAKLGERPAFFSVHVDSYDNLKMARMFLDLCSAVTAPVNIIVCNNTLLVNTVIQEKFPTGNQTVCSCRDGSILGRPYTRLFRSARTPHFLVTFRVLSRDDTRLVAG